jgi:hypothetical protein
MRHTLTGTQFPDGTVVAAFPVERPFGEGSLSVVQGGAVTFGNLYEGEQYVVRGYVAGRPLEERFESGYLEDPSELENPVGGLLVAGGGIGLQWDEDQQRWTITNTSPAQPQQVYVPAIPVRSLSTATTAYSLVAADQFSAVHATASSTVTVTVPPLSVLGWDTETTADGRLASPWCVVSRRGAGAVQFAAGSGVTLQGVGAAPLSVKAQFGTVRLRLVNTAGGGTWQVEGDLTPAATGGGVVAPANTVAPAISGTGTVGNTLSVSQGTWSNSPDSFSYQWKRGATNVGSNSASYLLTSLDSGASITCVVTASNSAGSASATSSNGVSVSSSAKATPIFDGSTRASWATREVSIPGSSANGVTTLPTGGTANGTNIIEFSTDPLGVMPAGVKTLQFHQNEADGNSSTGYIRLQTISSPVVQIDGSKTYWMRRCIAFPSNFPSPDAGAFYSLGSYFGEPYGGTSALPLGMVKKNGVEYLMFTPNAWDAVWQIPLVRGTYHKIVLRAKTVNYTKYPSAGPGWVEVYYAPWGQPLKLQTLTGTGGTGTTANATYPKQLVNNNTRLEFQTIKDGHNSGVNTFRLGSYRTFPQANFSGFNDMYHAQAAIFDDATVSGVAAVDPE